MEAPMFTKKVYTILAILVSLVGCTNQSPQSQLAPVGSKIENEVLKSRTYFNVSNGGVQISRFKLLSLLLPKAHADGVSASTDSDISTETTWDFSLLENPIWSENQIQDLGAITVEYLYDNNLNVCGDSGTDRCTKAIFKIYTFGGQPGFYDSITGYSAPLYGGLYGSLQTVGLGSENAAIAVSIDIPTDADAVTDELFDTLDFNLKVDYTNIPTGSYSGMVVIEYLLE
jgi:hypothetical protein